MLAHSREKTGFVTDRGNRWQMLNRKIRIQRNDYNDLNMCAPIRAGKESREEIKASICAGDQDKTEGYLLQFMLSLSY